MIKSINQVLKGNKYKYARKMANNYGIYNAKFRNAITLCNNI